MEIKEIFNQILNSDNNEAILISIRLITSYKYNLEIEIYDCQYCSKCKEELDSEKKLIFDCKHYICFYDMKKAILEKLKSINLEVLSRENLVERIKSLLKCPICDENNLSNIKNSNQIDIFYNELIETLKLKKNFNCPILMEDFSIQFGIKMPCCKQLLSKQGFVSCVDDKIRDYTTKEFLCFLCEKDKIPDELIKNHINKESYRKYLTKLQTIKMDLENKLNEDERYLDCPGCSNKYVISKTIFEEHIPTAQICNKCCCSFCPQCMFDSHPGFSCEDYKIEKRKKHLMSESEKELEILKKSFQLKTCPHCGLHALKDNKCKFTYCSSKSCLSKKFFCWLCLDKLEQSQHFLHFFNKPFGEFCINKPPPK